MNKLHHEEEVKKFAQEARKITYNVGSASSKDASQVLNDINIVEPAASGNLGFNREISNFGNADTQSQNF
jgi:hypothetical protein